MTSAASRDFATAVAGATVEVDRPSSVSSNNAIVKGVFHKVDADGSGAIDKQEMARIFLDISDLSEEAINELFEAAYVDKDGQLNYEEFLDFVFEISAELRQASEEDRQKIKGALRGLRSEESSQPAQCCKHVHCTAHRQLFIGANWKCSLESEEQVQGLLAQLSERWSGQGPPGIELCIFPPSVFLDRARQSLSRNIRIGSQNAWDAAEGWSCTGVVTGKMLAAVGCDWVMLGHSDLRNVLGESDSLISEKVERVLSSGLSVNITIGEKLEARESGDYMGVLCSQLGAAAQGVPADAWGRVAIAYEPVWAVGEGAIPCSPEETQRVHSSLRAWLAEKVSFRAAQECRILYTGSVNEKNAAEYSKLPDVDGFIVGRAGLDITKLASICETLVSCKETAMVTDSPLAGA